MKKEPVSHYWYKLDKPNKERGEKREPLLMVAVN